MNEFIVCYTKRAEARCGGRSQCAAYFASQTPISIGGVGGAYTIIGIPLVSLVFRHDYIEWGKERIFSTDMIRFFLNSLYS